MKKFLLLLAIVSITLSCSKETVNNNNPYLPTYRFTSSVINLNFYPQLRISGNAIEYYEIGVGVLDKVIIINTGFGFSAFDATCPNQAISSCSTMDLVGITAVCPCDNAQYSLYSGQATDMQYPMLQYRVEVLSETSIRVYN